MMRPRCFDEILWECKKMNFAEKHERDAVSLLKLAAMANEEEEMDRYAAMAIMCMREAIKCLLPENLEESIKR